MPYRYSRTLVLLAAVLASGCRHDSQTKIDPYAALPGTWGWAESDDCEASPELIAFSADRKQMFLSHAPIRENGTREPHRKVSYRILDEFHNGLSMSLGGEDRLDDSGKPVTWDLIMLGQNEYCWHRNDWPQNGCTRSLHRCDI